MIGSFRFKKEQMIGSGGFGDVWRALDTQNDKLVALKQPGKEICYCDNVFAKEIKILRILSSHQFKGNFLFNLEGFPKIYYYNSSFNEYAQKLLGVSLNTIIEKKKMQLSVLAVCSLGI